MDSGWVAAIASVASAVVVAITAVAAFAQIRHVRNANDITVYLRLVDRLDSPEAQAAFALIDPFLERLKNDADLRARIAAPGPVPEFGQIASLVSFLEHLSTLILLGGMSERLVLAEYADNIEHTWDRLAESIYLRRRAINRPYIAVAFENLAMRSKAFLAEGEMERLYSKLQRDPRMANFGDAAAGRPD
jgi:hypothetical protein